jgi:hypothetical protein
MRLLAAFALLVSFACAGRTLAADFPKGTFTTKADEATWAVTFDGKGKYSVAMEGKDVLKGTYKITKDEIEFTEEEGDFAHKGDQAKYTYKWKQDGKKISFTKVKDEDAGREKVITGAAWQQKD